MKRGFDKFAENLRLLRKGHGLTQTQLAEKVGVTKQSIINYEKGITFPTGNRLNDLIAVLNVEPEQLLGKDLTQLPSEQKLMDAIKNKAGLLSTFTQFEEEQVDYDIVRETLLSNLTALKLYDFSNQELKWLLSTIYDKKIEDAKSEMISEMIDQNLYGNPVTTDIEIPK